MKTAEQLLKDTIFAVEADSFEQHCLWAQTAKDSPYYPDYKKYGWEQMHGWLITVGKLAKRPVCMNISWVKIDGQLVMFWYGCSQVTDSVMYEKWFKKNFTKKYGTRPAQCDAMNFGHCLSAIREFKKQ